MKRFVYSFAVLLALGILPATAFAQSPEEIKFGKKQAAQLHSYAKRAFKKGYPLNAKRVWLMLLSEYDTHHARSRAALGYRRLGNSWQLDPEFVYPKHDKPDAGAASMLRKKWFTLAKTLAAGHRRMAQQYEKAGRTDMSKSHYAKVLFFLPDDEKAQEALNHQPVAGLTGTALEQTLYDRSKKIERAVAEEARKDYPVETLPESAKHPLLEKAKVKYRSVKSEHFTVRGDLELELLIEAAVNAERAIRVMNVAYDGFDGFSKNPKTWLCDWGFFKEKDTYKQILKANADLIDPKNLEFLLEHSTGTAIRSQQVAIRVTAAGNQKGSIDSAVRNVAQSYSGFRSDALIEGIGHTFVGMFFNNNRLFVVDRKKQIGTSASEEDLEKYSPNFDAWKDLALEAAWKLAEGTPAAQLPIIQAAKFPDDARIKSWSFCDYVMRRDTTLLQDMDRLRGVRNPIELEKRFTKAHDGLSIAQLEKEWKDFWTEASPVLRAIRNNTPPLASVSKDIKKWIKEFNKARKSLNSTQVTWSSAYSSRCKDHVEYLLANKDQREPDELQQQSIDLEGGSHLGSMFAQMCLVAISPKKPKALFAKWLDYPGYRDALLNNSLRTIGMYSRKGVVVMDCIRGVGRAPKGKRFYRSYPTNQQQGIPNQIKVAELGSEVRALLEKKGHGKLEVLGYPLSLHHFGTGGLSGSRDSYRCRVTIGKKTMEGIYHIADGGYNRRSSAPGLVVFYPLKPLKKGSRVHVVWTFEHAEGSSRNSFSFFTK